MQTLFPHVAFALGVLLVVVGPVGAEEAHWSLRPLVAPRVPISKPAAANPVDAFVRDKLREHGLTPSPAASRRTLIRRLTYNLHGLPPTPAEIAAFEADRSPLAYDRLVDRLLASPRYGERWARHWLDVAHYAETHGHDQDAVREHAWPYRDYLVQSFNADKPYARFVREQVAGDVLYPDDPAATVALGFLAAGPWDESSQKDIRDDTIDKKQAQYIDRDDILTTVFTAFASTSVHCARCHDHKFDPIPQAEYFGVQAVFAGVERANRSYDPDPAIARTRRDLNRRRADILADRFAPAAEGHVIEAWESSLGRIAEWNPLSVTAAAESSRVEPVADRSVRFFGPRPEKDTYTLTFAVPDRTTALRLEVMTDPSLPHRGPGRQDNGNLHLSEVRVYLGDAKGKPVPISSAAADFNQDGWEIARAIDGKPPTAWGIYPAVGKSHEAMFVLAEPVPAGSRLAVRLDQHHGGGHLIGRLRLSATGHAKPSLGTSALPEAVRAALAVAKDRRTPDQRRVIARHALLTQTDDQLASLPKQSEVYAAASDFKPLGSFLPPKGPRTIHMLRRGEVTRPGDVCQPGALSCVSGPKFNLADPSTEGARRAALADWLTDPANGLVWRSIVNRVWHYHFGRGIVSTPNDFGLMGSWPTHPELLDWLAVWFRDRGGSLKDLHRLIVSSETYRQVSDNRPEHANRDADNTYLWRMNRARLDAESVRDAVLATSGALDDRMGGPSDRHFVLSKGVHVTPDVDYLKFDVDSAAARRRSVYRFVFRTLPDPFLEALDCPDASQFTPVRPTSVTALQALAMLNDRFTVRYAEHLASRLEREGPDLPARIARGYELTLGRTPTAAERDRLAKYAADHGLANACRLLFNCNEFLFLE
ncbi:MAG TPA: DUF1549 and DUF1553 domain-containing protein [Gemmataceae bacterium]|nr:DUF1549 and DUF1553 domain-containing protein [Gemmataceae bacterium]